MKLSCKLTSQAALLSLCMSLLASGGNALAATVLNLTAGWNLLGNGSAAPIEVATTFADATKIAAVWKWNRSAGTWALYAPSLSSAELPTPICNTPRVSSSTLDLCPISSPATVFQACCNCSLP